MFELTVAKLNGLVAFVAIHCRVSDTSHIRGTQNGLLIEILGP